jgi:iron-sulfur cluster repair protein YtfE (RIC family)
LSNLQKLRQEHGDLLKLVGRLREAVDAPCSPPIVELYQLRSELASTLIAHLKAEDWAVYPRLMACGDAEIAGTAKAFSDEMGGLAEAFAVYTQRWDAMSIQVDWHSFCLETKDIIAALTNRITRENKDLYPLVERLDRAA